MDKREEIREGIVTLLKRVRANDTQEGMAIVLLEYLHSQGCVLKVDRGRILEYNNYNDPARELDTRFEIVAVEPLVEE